MHIREDYMFAKFLKKQQHFAFPPFTITSIKGSIKVLPLHFHFYFVLAATHKSTTFTFPPLLGTNSNS